MVASLPNAGAAGPTDGATAPTAAPRAPATQRARRSRLAPPAPNLLWYQREPPMPSIAVRDFGPIARAEIDLKPLTVLIGPNNTGKSYLALAVYSVFQSVLRIRDQKYRPTRSRNTTDQPYVFENFVRRLKRAGGDWRGTKNDIVRVISGESELHKLPEPIKRAVRDESKLWAKVYSDYIAYELQRCFGSRMSKLDRKNSQSNHRGFAIDMCDESTGLSWTIRCSGDAMTIEKWKPDTSVSDTIRLSLISSDETMDEVGLAKSLTTWYSAFLLRSITRGLHPER